MTRNVPTRTLTHHASRITLLLPDAVQLASAPQKETRAGDGDGSQGVVAIQCVRGQELELRTGGQDGGDSAVVGDVELTVREKGRGVHRAHSGALRSPDDRAGLGIEAGDYPAVVHQIKV